MATVTVAALGLGGLTGCGSSEEEPPVRTRTECRDSPALSGCSYGLPTHVYERREERKAQAAARRQQYRRSDIGQFIRKERRKERRKEQRKEQRKERSNNRSGTLIEQWTETTPEQGTRQCWDVTSYDWNWDNDMLCTDTNGRRFYTSYEGANAFLGY